MGETRGLGAFLNLTTKSGGDRIAGDVYVDFLNDGSVADNVPGALREGGGTLGRYRAPPGGLRAGNPLTLQGDGNMGIGGPLRRSRTWFYAGYRLNHQEELTIGHPNPSTTQLENWTAKVTHQFNDGSQLVGFFNHRTKLQPERGLGGGPIRLPRPEREPPAGCWAERRSRGLAGARTADRDVRRGRNGHFRTISGPRYNEIIAMLNPRVFRAGLRLEF